MTPRKQRMLFVGIIVTGVSIATVLALLAISENMMYFYTPTQVNKGEAPSDAKIRVGGLVVKGSVKRQPDDLTVEFALTDTTESVVVRYTGILPDLFREGQGIVTMGRLNAANVFIADEVLAKHDENYMPPEVADALKNAEGKLEMPSSHIKPN